MHDEKSLAPINPSGHELATSAAAQAAKSMIEAAYTMAVHRPRDMATARIKLLEACSRPRFAETALYKKPVGGGKCIEGLSIRAAEEAVRLWGNLRVAVSVIYEDENKRIVDILMVDLETNAAYSQQITVEKIIERKFVKEGQEKVYERLNSQGKTVFGVRPTPDELDIKQAALVSKAIRNLALRLIPSDIREEMEEHIRKTNAGTIKENLPEARKKMLDAFASIGVYPKDLGKLPCVNGQEIESLSPTQIEELKQIYATIRDGEATFASYFEVEEEIPNTAAKEPARAKAKPAAKQPEKGELKPGGDTLAKTGLDETRAVIRSLEKKIKGIDKGFDFGSLGVDMGDLDAYGAALSKKLGEMKKQ